MADPNEFDDVMPDHPAYEEQPQEEVNENLFLRFVFMIVIWFMMGLASTVIGFLAFLQAVILLVNGKKPNERIADLGTDIGIWFAKATRYISGASDVKPWPWTELD